MSRDDLRKLLDRIDDQTDPQRIRWYGEQVVALLIDLRAALVEFAVPPAPPTGWQAFEGKAFGLWETNMRGDKTLVGIALTHEAASAWCSEWFPEGCSRTALNYNLVPLPPAPLAATTGEKVTDLYSG